MPPRLERAGKVDSANRAHAKQQMLTEIHRQLMASQSAYKTLLGSLMGAIAAQCAFVALAIIDSGMLLLYLLPPAMVGLGARLLGRCFEWRLLLIPAAIASGVYLMAFWLLLPYDSRDLIVIPLGVLLATYLARRPLSELEKQALWQAKINSLGTKSPQGQTPE